MRRTLKTYEKKKNGENQYFRFFQQCFLAYQRHKSQLKLTFNLSSAKAFSLVKDKMLSFGNELTHYHTMPRFDARKICSCGKHCEKRRNCL